MLRLNVPDMTCSHCVRAVTSAVKEVEPTAEVQIDLEARRVRVQGAANAQQVESAIREAGYTPEAVAS